MIHLLTAAPVILLLVLAAQGQEGKKLDAKKAEAAVKAFVKDNVGDPDSLKWVRLGPHDLEGKVGFVARSYQNLLFTLTLEKEDLGHMGTNWQAVAAKLRKLKTKEPLPLARVRYRLANKTGGKELHDTLFVVYGDLAIPIGKNRFGDGWAGHLAELIRKAKK